MELGKLLDIHQTLVIHTRSNKIGIQLKSILLFIQ